MVGTQAEGFLGHVAMQGHSITIELREIGPAQLRIPPGVTALRLKSPSGMAGEDVRWLGALLNGFVLDGVALDLADGRFGNGFHPVETHDGVLVRWTNGDAVILIGPAAEERWCEISVAALVANSPRDIQRVQLEQEGACCLLLPPKVGELRLVSSWGEAPGDIRRLGALVARIAIGDKMIGLGDEGVVAGFHELERHDGQEVRWTDGEGVILFSPSGEPRWCEIEVRKVMK